MTEQETIQHAKNYLDKLAQGINPLTNEPVPEEELINNVRISRCFFFVSDVLRRVIENGGTETPRVQRKNGTLPFAVSREALGRFEYSEEPILVSHIANRVNNLLADENVKRLTGAAILNWLEGIGMVEMLETESGRRSRRPTPKGSTMGISLQLRNGPAGEYQAVVYNRQAQQFIVDNMEAIAELARG